MHSETSDEQEVALRSLQRRVVRLRGIVAVGCVLAAASLCLAIVVGLREVGIEYRGVHWHLEGGGLSAVAEADGTQWTVISPFFWIVPLLVLSGPVALIIALGRWLGRALVRLRAPRWVEDLSAWHRVPAQELSDYLAVWDAGARRPDDTRVP